MPCNSIVRIAKPADRKECWRLLMQGHSENGVFGLSSDKVNWWLNRVLDPDSLPPWDTGPRGAIGVIGEVGRLEGLAFVIISSYWYSDEKHLEEFIVYVDPECRKSNHAKALVNWMKAQSETIGFPLVTGIMSNNRTEAKVRLYERMLPKVGAFFCYRPAIIGATDFVTAGSS